MLHPKHHFISNCQKPCSSEASTIKIYPSSSPLLPGLSSCHFFLSLQNLASGSLVSSTPHLHSTYITARYWIPMPTQMYHLWSLWRYHVHLDLESLCILIFDDPPFNALWPPSPRLLPQKTHHPSDSKFWHPTHQPCISIHQDIWPSMCACILICVSHVPLFEPLTVACQAPLSMGFFKQEYWNGLSCPPPGDLPGPGIKPEPHAFLPLSHRRSPLDQAYPTAKILLTQHNF